MVSRVNGLYIHIPFCSKVCDYCDFSVLSAPERMHGEFVDLLIKELNCLMKRYPEFRSDCETLYIGGGTPSLLSESLLLKIFSEIKNLGFSLCWKEATMELNPESCSKEKLNLARNFGVNRFSLGVQTFSKNLLNLVGRKHTPEMAHQALSLLREMQSDGIQYSADLMFMLPNQTLENFISDLESLVGYSPDHISFYGLQVTPNTLLESRIRRGKLIVDETLYAPMYNTGVSLLKEKGYERYEVSNFSKPGKESVHNLNYWCRGEYLGIGPGAHSYFEKVRFNAPTRYGNWKKWVLAGCPESLYEKDVLNRESEILEEIWLSLRLSKGLDLEHLKKKYDYDLVEEKMDYWVKKNYLQKKGNRISLIGNGWLMMDQVVSDLSP